jgi:hypothetical protein
MSTVPARAWLLLVHRIPAKPLYRRAKFRARLDRAGAVPLKSSVYALPARGEGLETLTAIARDIREEGGESFVCEARFLDSRDEARLIEAFRTRRAAEYRSVADEAGALHGTVGAATRARGRAGPSMRRRLGRLERRLEWARSVDPFGAAGHERAKAALERLGRRLLGSARASGPDSEWTGRTWVTRRGVHVDRMACAWFIRRFLDPVARFRFVGDVRERSAGELAFDLPGGDFTHEANRCSFETLLARTGCTTVALERIAEIVHDLDLKDGRFGHPETAGIERLVSGIVAAQSDDVARLERGAMLFDDLHRSLVRTPAIAPPARAPRGPRRRA